MEIKSFLFMLLFVTVFQIGKAQDLIGSSGNTFISENGSMSFSIGEVMSETFIKDTVALTQGVQQISITITPLSTDSKLLEVINIYPNPTSEYLNIEIPEKESFKLTLMSIEGKVILKKEVHEPYSLDLSPFQSGEYILLLTPKSKKSISYKIIKQ